MVAVGARVVGARRDLEVVVIISAAVAVRRDAAEAASGQKELRELFRRFADVLAVDGQALLGAPRVGLQQHV